eukprot:scaffold5860_cov103-Isochrysis_galbana.AAC.2
MGEGRGGGVWCAGRGCRCSAGRAQDTGPSAVVAAARRKQRTAEALGQVLDDNAVRRGEEGEHVRDEVALRVVQPLPVLAVGAQIYLLCSPEGRLVLLVHAPQVAVLNREQYKAVIRRTANGLDEAVVQRSRVIAARSAGARVVASVQLPIRARARGRRTILR